MLLLPILALSGLAGSAMARQGPLRLDSDHPLLKRLAEDPNTPGFISVTNETLAYPAGGGGVDKDGKPVGAVGVPLNELRKRDDGGPTDYAARCPGGSVGDAKQCSFQPNKIYNTPLERWRLYGSKQVNCDGDTSITHTVTESSTIGNTISETTELSVSVSMGIESEGVSAGFSVSTTEAFTNSWGSSETLSSMQTIEVPAGSEGGMLVYHKFYLSEGRVRIVYDHKQEGHWTWYLHPITIWNRVPDSAATYSPDVDTCPHGQNTKAWWYYQDDYDDVVNGDYSALDYPENSDDPNCDEC